MADLRGLLAAHVGCCIHRGSDEALTDALLVSGWLAERDASVRERALWDAAAAIEAATPEAQPELPIVTGERSGFIHAHHIVSEMRNPPESRTDAEGGDRS